MSGKTLKIQQLRSRVTLAQMRTGWTGFWCAVQTERELLYRALEFQHRRTILNHARHIAVTQWRAVADGAKLSRRFQDERAKMCEDSSKLKVEVLRLEDVLKISQRVNRVHEMEFERMQRESGAGSVCQTRLKQTFLASRPLRAAAPSKSAHDSEMELGVSTATRHVEALGLPP